jgi:hypothetical protein
MRAPRRESRWSAGRVQRRAQYAAYLVSADWFRRRERWYADHLAITGTPPVCSVCGRTWLLDDGHLHHRTYDRLRSERHHDLLPLCRAHHRALHALWDACPPWRRLGRARASAGSIAVLRHALPTEAYRKRADHS